MALLHPSRKLPEDITQATGGSDQDWWETGLPSQKVRMGFACVFGFLTFKEVEFLPGKREMRNLEKITEDQTNKQTKLVLE